MPAGYGGGVGTASRRNSSAIPALIVAILVLAGVGIAVGIVGARHSSKTTPPAAAEGKGRTTPPPASGAPKEPADPAAVAQSIGLQARDLSGYAYAKATGAGTAGGNIPQAATNACTINVGQPWAAVASPSYANASSAAFSQVFLFPTAADAQGAVSGLTVPTTGPQCRQQKDDKFAHDFVQGFNQSASCPLSFVSSTIAPLTASTAWPGAVGYRYAATLSCSGQPPNQLIVDTALMHVGNVFIEGNFTSFGAPQTSLEQNVMDAMTSRAQNYVDSK